jgi:thiosulfate reductase cytochrome b subunit
LADSAEQPVSMDLTQLGKFVVIAGVLLVVSGLLIMVAGRLPFFGNLPGDFTVRRGNTTIFAPIATMIILSIVLTIALNLLLRR